jgi:hypothetical protein
VKNHRFFVLGKAFTCKEKKASLLTLGLLQLQVIPKDEDESQSMQRAFLVEKVK